jgi:predicted permease
VVDQLVVVTTAGSDKQNSRTTAVSTSVTVIGRLRPDASLDTAAAEIATTGLQFDSMWPRYAETAAGRQPAPRNWTAATLDEVQRRGFAEGTGIAAAIVMVFALVLAVACTNLTNLTLARGAARQTELTVRRALGASRLRLVRELTIESVLVGLAGGVVALLTARWLIAYISTEISLFGTTLAEMFDPRLDYSSYVFGAGAVTVAFVVVGLLPAMRLTRDERSASLARSTSASGARWRGQRSLIRAQIAVSMLLVLTAAFCVAVVVRGTRQATGLDLEHLVIAQMGFADQARDPVRSQAAADAVLRELRADPLFERAAMTSGLPSASATFATVAPDDRPEQLQTSERYVLAVATPGLTEVLGVPLLSGRPLDHRDSPGSMPVAVVSASLARKVFGTTEIVGRRIAIEVLSQALSRTSRTVAGKLASLSTVAGPAPKPGEPAPNDLRVLTIVGVTADTQVEWGRVDTGVVYVPLAQVYEPLTRIVARRSVSASEDAALMALRNAVRRAGDDLAVTSAGTGEQVLAPERAALKVISGLTTALGGFALALTMIGLYGVLSHVVVRRTRELCLRLALGATPGQLLRMVIRDGLRPVIGGAVIGMVIGIPIRIAAHDALDEFLTIEPWLFAGVTLGFIVFGAAACYRPARRAASVDPNIALKEL